MGRDMKSRRVLLLAVSALCLLAAAVTALYLTNRREVTTSSPAAYKAYRQAIENEQRFYMKEARVGFARALELDPEFAMAMLGLARKSDPDQALSQVERASRLRDRLTERERLHVDLQRAELKHKSDEVLRLSRAIHERYPNDIRGVEYLAGEELRLGHTDRAVKMFTELLAIDPNNALAYNQIGYYYGYRGDYERAIENLKKYQFMAPDQANPHDSLGEIQAYSGHYDEAIQNLNRALAIKPDFYPALEHMGVVSEGKGDFPAAIQWYEKAAEQAVTDGMREMYLKRALRVTFYWHDRPTFDRLVAQLERLPKSERTELMKPVLRAATYLIDGRPAEAEKLLAELKPKLEAAISKVAPQGYKPYDSGWTFLMAHAKIAQHKEDEAIPLFVEMANPPNPWLDCEGRRWVYEGRANLAAQLARKGDLNGAEKLLAENRKWNPSWAPTRAAEEAVAQARREKVLAAAK
jgi:tetratricopeptide (TPR) repeat protein